MSNGLHKIIFEGIAGYIPHVCIREMTMLRDAGYGECSIA